LHLERILRIVHRSNKTLLDMNFSNRLRDNGLKCKLFFVFMKHNISILRYPYQQRVAIAYIYIYIYIYIYKQRLPLWSSGQSSWLQIQRPEFDSRHYQIF
jgi:hypothetical protein